MLFSGSKVTVQKIEIHYSDAKALSGIRVFLSNGMCSPLFVGKRQVKGEKTEKEAGQEFYEGYIEKHCGAGSDTLIFDSS